jgi:Pol polyprotein
MAASQRSSIQQSDPLPSFYQARSRLILEETRRNHQAAKEAAEDATALTVSSDSLLDESAAMQNSPGASPNPRNNNHNNRRGGKKKNKGKGRGKNGGGSSSNQWQRAPSPRTPGILGPRPSAQAYNVQAPSTVGYAPTDITAAMHTMPLNPPDDNWYMDTGARSHMTSHPGTLSSYFYLSNNNRHIIVGSGQNIPIHGCGRTLLSSLNPPLALQNVLHAPNLIKNLISLQTSALSSSSSIIP